MRRFIYGGLVLSLLLTGCATVKQVDEFEYGYEEEDSKSGNSGSGNSNSDNAADVSAFVTEYSDKLGITLPATCNQTFIKYIYGWIGTPYEYAGESKSGTDCSGFTMMVYQDVYGKSIERGSSAQHGQAKEIKKENLREGDLVFFKINTEKVGHVGIYITDGYFVHASSSKGVMISNLSENYYAKYYFSSGRIE